MIYSAFITVIYTPLYNALVLLISTISYGDVGFAIIILTIVVKTLLFPLTHKATQTQLILKQIAPKLEELKKKYKDNQQEQVKNMLALYKEYKVNPLAGILTILIQLPIIIGLYQVFLKGGLPVVDVAALYSFVDAPETVNMFFLGFLDLSTRSIPLAVLAGVTQFVIAHITFEAPIITTKPGESLKDDIMRNLHLQTKYMLPLMIVVFAYFLSAAVALHWVAGNIYTITQETLVRRRFHGIKGG